MSDDAHKLCKVCGESRPLSLFHKKGEGLDYRCKHCKKELYQTNREQILSKAKANYHSTKEATCARQSTVEWHLKRLVNCSKRKRTELSLEFMINLYERQKGLCALTGKKMTYLAGQGSVPANMSIDRIDNSVWYKEDNVQLVCHKVNVMRNDLSTDELKEWCNSILENLDG